MRYIYDNIGFIPVYLPEIESVAQYEALEDAPLSALWGEHDTPEGVAFTISVNPELVADIYSAYDDLTSWEQVGPLIDAIGKVCRGAIADLVMRHNKRPSEVCVDYWQHGIR